MVSDDELPSSNIETSNYSSEHQQFLSSIDQLFSSQPNQTTTSSSSMVKIIDIQRSKRKCGGSQNYDNHQQQQQQQQHHHQQGWSQQQQQGTSTSREQTTSNNSQQYINNQQQQQSSSTNQKQPSGETLSSFESDYDLLVYLGETETEDIVDTERSLDYQDQTWRQSICGGASLAPTIDDSLNGELFSGTSSSNANYHHLRDTSDDFDLLNTPTPTAATFGSGSPFFTPPTAASSIGAGRNQPTTSISTSSLANPAAAVGRENTPYLRRADELNAESDDCDNEVLLVFNQQLGGKNNSELVKPVTRLVQRSSENIPHTSSIAAATINESAVKRIDGQPGNQKQKSETNIGNKLVSLFNRRPHLNDDAQQSRAKLTMGRPTFESNRYANTQSSQPYRIEQTMPQSSASGEGRSNNDDNAAELDRLLAEMNESLDLKSLAQYDPMSSRYPASRRHEQRSQTLNPRNSGGQQQPYYATQAPVTWRQQQQFTTPNNISQSSRNLNLANVEQSNANPSEEWPRSSNITSQQQQQQHKQNLVAESESSILDEYDGASRMLEQMISDQLLDRNQKTETKRQQQQAERQSKPSTNQTVSRPARPMAVGSSKPSSIVAEDFFPDGRDTTRAIDNESPSKTASSTRKVSTCSSSVATEASIVLANPHGVIQSLAKTSSGSQGEQSTKKNLEQRGEPLSVWSSRGSNRKIVKQSSSFDHGMPSESRLSNVLVNSKQPPTSRSFDLVEHAAETARKSNDNHSSANDRPPTPPRVDYNDDSSVIVMHEVDHDGGKVIRLEATEFPLDEIGSETDEFPKSQQTTNETQIDKMKRRTLSSMRSMRNKFNDFIAVNNRANSNQIDATHQRTNQHHQQAIKATTDDKARSQQQQQQQQQRAPQPPKRSSSISSQNSNANQSRNNSQNRRSRLDHEETKGVTAKQQQRESRSRAPREKQQKQSFGQQIRERLSRSKSRFSKFLRPSSTRAQSSPNIKGNKPTDHQMDDSELFQPSDIARNSCEPTVLKRDSFDDSLDRHLAASLDKDDKQKVQSSLSSSSLSLSDLSGLDKTKLESRSRPRSRTKPAGNHSDRERSKEKRPSSLISLRRLGSFRSKKRSPPAEDFDSMQVKTSNEIHTVANRKRATTLQLPRMNRGDREPSDNRSAKSWVCDNPSEHDTKDTSKPNRSQSMKSISDDKDQPVAVEASDSRKLQSGNRTVSFSNLQQQRRLPASVNTFRPASACAQLEPAAQGNQITTGSEDNKMNESRAAAIVTPTPIGLSSDPLVGRRLESAKPPQLEHHHQSRLTPLRVKGATMIDDIKQKCSELFSSTGDHSATQRSRGRQSRDTDASMPPSNSTQVQMSSSSRSPEPPVRPPRKRGLQQRSKSVSARPATLSEKPDDEHQLYVVELRAATPGSSLDRGHMMPTQLTERSQQQQSPVGEKLASLAKQLKHSAADFFHQPDAKRQHDSGRKSSSKSPLRAPDETIVPTGDLREWEPVIKSSSRPASGRSFRALGDKDKPTNEEQTTTMTRLVDDRGLTVGVHDRVAASIHKQQHSSPDSDSTWESTGDDEDAQAQPHENDGGKMVANQTKSDQLDDESSLARLRVINEPNNDNDRQRQQPATTCRTGTADDDDDKEQVGGNSNSSNSNRLCSAAVGHKFDDEEQDRNNNNSNKARKELLRSSERYQPKSVVEFKQKRAYDSDAAVSEDYLKIIRQQKLKQEQQQETTAAATVISDGSAASEEIDENYEHERNIDVDNRSVHRQQQQELQPSMRNNSAHEDQSRKIIHSDSKPFKFNPNIPSPSQLLQESNEEENFPSTIFELSGAAAVAKKEQEVNDKKEHSFVDDNLGRDEMARVALKSQQPMQKLAPTTQQQSRSPRFTQDTTAQDPERSNTCEPGNRLSMYENVSESDEVSHQATKSPYADNSSKRREWRRPTSPPHVPAKPSYLMSGVGGDMISSISERIRPPRSVVGQRQHQRKSSSSDDDWSTQDFVVPEENLPPRKSPEQDKSRVSEQQQQQQPVEATRGSERKLVTMTSIIHEPIDDLMEARPSGRISSVSQNTNNKSNNTRQQGGRMSSASLLQRRDSNFGTDNDYADSDDTDSSFAAAATSRQRLVRKFEQKGSLPRPEISTRAKFPAFNEGKSAANSSSRGDSLVKRMARNFDQTDQERPAAHSQRPLVPSKKVSQTAATTTTVATAIMKSFDDDSAADWCDARSADLVLDESEIAEFLQDFDRKPAEQNRSSAAATTTGSNSDNQQKRPTASNTTVTLTEISGQEASEACSSVSTGADPYVTVADSTFGGDDNDDGNDDDDQQLNGYAEQRPRRQTATATGTTSDDDTLNDDELGDEDDDDVENVLMGNQAQLTLEDEDDLTESYTSAHGTLPRARGEPSQQQQQQPQQQQGKHIRTTASDAFAQSPSSSRKEKSRFMSACERDDIFSTCSPKSASKVREENFVAPAPVSDNLPATSNLATPKLPTVLKETNKSLSAASLSDNYSNDNDIEILTASATKTVPENTQSASFKSTSSSGLESRPQSRVAQSDEGNENDRRTNLIDDHFKNSLNHIIARRSSSPRSSVASGQVVSNRDDNISTAKTQQQMPTTTRDSRRSSKETDTKRKKNKSSSRELRGLSKFYHVLLGSKRHRKRSDNKSAKKTNNSNNNNNRDDKKQQDYIHSSSSSACSSSGESSTAVSSDSEEDDDDDDESMDDKKLVEVAKKCSRIYVELERILERRLAKENHKPTSGNSGVKQESQQAHFSCNEERRSRAGDDKDNINDRGDYLARNMMEDDDEAATIEAGDDMGYEESLCTIMRSEEKQRQNREGSVEDRVSLSSSSVSSESIPEIRLRKNLQKLYHVVNEICSSEAKFVDTLRLLNVDFRQHIVSGSSSSSSSSSTNVIPQDRLDSMLKHLPQLQALNENLLAELEQARSQWPQTQKIAHVLVKVGPFLKHYSTYIREFESMQQQYNENLKKYPQFAHRVRVFEASERCKKLTIQHHILKPIQRIPQYRLLLQQYLHNLKPDDVDYEDTVNALEVVSRVAEHANHSMSEGVNFAKLLALQAKIVGKQRDIVQPGRVFIKEGELMKVQSSDILFLKNELPLDGCLVSVAADETDEILADPGKGDQPKQHQEQSVSESGKQKHQQQSDKEFSVSTRTRSFALIAKTSVERDEWVSVLRRTVEEYMAKRRSFTSSIHRQQRDSSNQSLSSSPSSNSSSQQHNQHLQNRMIEEETPHQQHLLGQMAPIWTPDSRVSRCQLCTSSFSALFRRHHCRACGRVVCSACSSNKAPLIYLKCRAARVCDQCFDTLKANIHLYYLPPNHSGSLNCSVSSTLSDRLTMSGFEPLIGEEELCRLDEHFRTLLKSQFTRSTSLSKLASSGASSKNNNSSKTKKKTKNNKTTVLAVTSGSGENVAVTPAPAPLATTSK